MLILDVFDNGVPATRCASPDTKQEREIQRVMREAVKGARQANWSNTNQLSLLTWSP